MHSRNIKRQFHVLRMRLGLSDFHYTKLPGRFLLDKKYLSKRLKTLSERLFGIFLRYYKTVREYLRRINAKVLPLILIIISRVRLNIIYNFSLVTTTSTAFFKRYLGGHMQVAFRLKFNKYKYYVFRKDEKIFYIHKFKHLITVIQAITSERMDGIKTRLNNFNRLRIPSTSNLKSKIKNSISRLTEEIYQFQKRVKIISNSFTIKHYIILAVIFVSLFFVQSQLYKLKLVRVETTEAEFLSLSGNEDGKLKFDFNFASTNSINNLSSLVKPLISPTKEDVRLIIEDYLGNEIEPEFEIDKIDDNTFTVNVTPEVLPPGEYRAKLSLFNKGVYYESQARFAYGVLAINTNKSEYSPGETAHIQLASLRNDGHTICDADMTLTIRYPSGVTDDLDIERSGKCDRNNVTDVADYSSYFQVEEVGEYTLSLKNNGNEYQIEDVFQVVESPRIIVERIGPTRIYPFVPYKFILKVMAVDGFKGQVIEKVPESFLIDMKSEVDGDYRIIKWDVELSAGESTILEYEFDAPDISPELYLLGPVKVGEYVGSRSWQIAGDADEQVVFTTPGTNSWTVPAGVTSLTIETWGGGGGGQGGTYGLPGGGAGGGAYSKKVVAVTPSVSYNAVVGSGGAAGAANGGNGGNGGNSSFSANTGATTASGGTGATGSIGASGGTTNGSADLSYSGGNGGSGYQGITYIGAASAAATSVALPTHQKGDLIMIMAFRDDSITLPTVPAAGWMVLGTAAEANATSAILAYKVASNSSEVSGTWVGATEVVVEVYRGHAGIGIWLGNTGNSNQINYPALSLSVTDGSSWVAALGGHKTATNVEQAPSGMINRTFAGSESAGHDTNGGVSSWTSTNVSVNASSRWYSWVVEIKAVKSSTALTYVSSATGVTSVTMPTHQAGDLLVGFAYRDGNNSAPSIPTAENWRVWGSGSGANTNSSIIGYKVAASSSEASGTWTNATGVSVHVYRNHAGYGANADTGAASTTVTYPALTLQVTDGSSWVAGFAGHRSVDTDLQNPPSGMVSRSTFVNATNEIAGHDTNGGVSSWSDTNVAVGGTSLGWRARTMEIKSLIQPLGGGGGGSSAGIAANGNNGNNSSGSSGGSGATAPTNGGNGGAGGNSSAAGTNGSLPGGGGGGGGNLSVSGNAGGAGANGKVIITYSPPTGINISGSCKQENQSTNCTDTGTLRVAVNGSLQAQTQATVAGTWTISGILQPQIGDVITIFIDGAGETDEAVAVTTYDGTGDIGGIELVAQRLSIGNSDNRTITNVNLSQYDNSVSGDEDVFHEIDGTNDLTMVETSKPLAELYIKTGNTYRSASDNTGNVTVNDFEIPTGATFTADGNTITIKGDATPFVVAGTLNEDTSTITFNSASNTNIQAETYYHLNLQPSAAGGPTYTLSTGTLATRNLTIGNGTNPVTVNWTTNDPILNIGGNLTVNNNSSWSKSDTSTLTFNGAVTPVTLTDNNSTKQDLGKIAIDGPKEVDLGSSVTVQNMNVTAGDTLDLQSSGYSLKVTGSGTGASRPFILSGTLTEGTNSTVEFTGTSATEIQAETYHNLNLNQTGSTFTSSGNLTISNIFTIDAGTFNAGANTINLNGSGTPLVINGTFTSGTSTLKYRGTSATTVLAIQYYNLIVGDISLSSPVTYTSQTGTIDVLGSFSLGYSSGSTATFNANTNDTAMNVTGIFGFGEWSASYHASSNQAAPLTVSGTFSNYEGSFTHNNGKVILNSPENTFQSIMGPNTFYNLEITGGDREIRFQQSYTNAIDANGSLNLTGTDCNNMLRVRSGLKGFSAILDIDISATVTASHLDLQDINLTTKSVTAGNSVNSGNNSANWTISPNGCIGTSTNQDTTGSSFQRKIIYDDQNSRYWSFNHDGDEIEVKYSSDDGSTWTNPTTAASGRLPYDTNDFSVWWSSISSVEYIVVAVVDGGNIKLRQGVLSETDITWDTDVSLAMDETGTYSAPYVSSDSANHIWLGATYNDGTDYVYKTVVSAEDASTDPSTWTWTATPYQLSNAQTSSNVYGTITALSNEDMYATFVIDTELLGCRWDDSDVMWEDSLGASCLPTFGGSGESEYFDSLEEGLVAYWKMNETSWNGATDEVVDNSGNGNDGTTLGGVTTTGAGFERSGNFDGSDDYINVSDSTSMRIAESTDSFTISLWAKPAGTQFSSDNNIDIAGTESAATSSQGWVVRYYKGVSPPYFAFIGYDGTGGFAIDHYVEGGMDTDIWHHFVGIVDRGSGFASMYTDGVFSGQVNISSRGSFEKNIGMQIGATETTSPGSSRRFKGGVDDLRIYNRALSTEEVMKLYQLVPESVNIDDTSDFGSLPGASKQIVRTNNGTLYSFVNDGGNCEMWKSNNGVTWMNTDSEVCDSDSHVAIAIDSNDDIHAVYSDSVAINSLEYSKYITASDTFSSTEQVASDNMYDEHDVSSVAIALDGNDIAHVAFFHIDSTVPIHYMKYRNRVGGSWQTTVVIESSTGGWAEFRNVDININKDNVPEISYVQSEGDDLTVAIGNTNNASAFTLQDVDTSINDVSNQRGTAIGTNTGGDTWIAYVDASNNIALAKHANAASWSIWSTITTKTDIGYEPSIAIDGTGEIYVFYQNDENDIAYDIFDPVTGTWSGEEVLHTGTFQDVKTKWSFEWNNFGTNKIDYLYSDGTDVYYDSLNLRRIPTNIDDASDFGEINGTGRQIIRTSKGILYSFINDGGNCEMWKSENNGITWAIQDSADDPACTKIEGMAIDSTDKLYLIYSTGNPSYDLLYLTFTTHDNQFGTPETIVNYSASDSFRNASISLDENDIPHVVYTYYNFSTEQVTVNYDNRVNQVWNSSDVIIETVESNYPDITVDEDNIPIISYDNNVDFDLTLAVGNQNDASSFTLHDVDTDINDTAAEASTSVGIDSTGNTWVSYVRNDGSLDDITLAKRTDGNETSSWSSGWTIDITNNNIGFEPSLYIKGTDVYVFYEDDQDDIVYDMYNGTNWSGETVLEMHGALQDVKTKWSYINNYDSTGVAPVQTNTYYFDGSDAEASDPNGVWTNETNVDDSDYSTVATGTAKSEDNGLTNHISIEGTNGLGPGSISSVKSRFHGKSGYSIDFSSALDLVVDIYTDGGTSSGQFLGRIRNTDANSSWTDYVTLTTPSGGWSAEKISSLEAVIYNDLVPGAFDLIPEIGIIEILVESTNTTIQNEIDYLYSDGTDVFYNRLLLGSSSVGVQDSIVTGLSTGLHKNISTVGQTINTVDYVHLAYVNSSGSIYYDRYDGDWDYTNSSLDTNTDNTYLGLSKDASTNDVYLGYIGSTSDDIFTKKAAYSAGPSWSWGTSSTLVTDATEIYTNYSVNNTGNGKIGAIYSIGDLSPYNIGWETVLSIAINNAPTVGTVVVNNSQNIALTAGSTYNVSWTSTITDLDGNAEISGVTGKLYRSGVAEAESCTPDNNNCYADAVCDLTSCSGNTCTATCTAGMYFHADATDTNSTMPSEYWRGWMEAIDTHSDTGSAFSSINAPDVESLSALEIVTSIDYGLMLVGDSSAEQTTLVTNEGNVILDLELSGDNMCTDHPTCAGSMIPVGQQEYSMTTFSYGSGTDLTSSAFRIQLNLAKPTTSPSNQTKNLYWRLGLDPGQSLGVYSGSNVVLSKNDNLP